MSAHYGNYQGGVALVTVMLILALLTAVVSRLSLLNQIWLRQVDNSSSLVQASQATRAAQIWVSVILEDDNNEYDGNTDDWARPVITIPIAWGEMYGRVEDMQSRFNLNNLVDNEGKIDEPAYQQFRQLLRSLQLEPGVADAVVDWIDADSSSTGGQGAEDIYYLGLNRPYLPANRRFIDEQELRLVRGVDPITWDTLAPYITTLPEPTAVNINTASAVVIAAVLNSPQASATLMSEVERWVDDAQINPYPSMEEFTRQVSESLNINGLEGLAVGSSYFKAHTQMTFGSVQHRMATLYQRKGGRASILQQTRVLF
jgi:general secretion pathway protein K